MRLGLRLGLELELELGRGHCRRQRVMRAVLRGRVAKRGQHQSAGPRDSSVMEECA